MNGQIPFQYAILRYTNDVETGESLNIGLAVFSPSKPYFKAKLLIRYERLTQAFPGMDGEYYRSFVLHLQDSFDRVSENYDEQKPKLIRIDDPTDIREILGKVLSGQDAAIQLSEPRFGITANPDETVEYLFQRFVERYAKRDLTPSRDDDEVWLEFKRPLQKRKVLPHIQPAKLQIRNEIRQFNYVWRNGRINILHPQSLDLVQPESIHNKAQRLIGFATELSDSKDRPHLYVLLGKPQAHAAKVSKAYQNSKEFLSDHAKKLSMEITEEDKADEFADRIKAEVEAHKR